MTLRAFFSTGPMVAVLLGAAVAGAVWVPQADDWPGFRSDLGHTGSVAGTSLFLDGVGGFARVKWQATLDYPVLYAPNVVDLDGDGDKEVVATPSDVKTKVGPPPDIQFQHRLDVLDAATGAPVWRVEETNSFALLMGANAVSLDADDEAEVLYFAGNPLTGTSATNAFRARSHTGAEQWSFASVADWGSTQHPVGILSATQAADVDADAQNEAIVGVVLADIAVGTTPQGPGCPNPNGSKLKIEATNLHYYVYALNGDSSSPTVSWKIHVDPGLLVSTPAILDLNGDGHLDVVWGSGAPAGTLIPSCSAEVTVGSSAVDNRVLAIDGANPPGFLWTASFEDPPGVDRPIAATPTVAGSTPSGDPILVFLVPVAPGEPAANDPDRNILIALNGRTGATLWSTVLRPASIAPLAAADLDGDGQPEVIAQIANRLVALRNDGTDFWAQGTGDLRGVAYDRTLTSPGVAVADLDTDGTPEIATILFGNRTGPQSELLVVDGATGATEWAFPLLQDSVLGAPVLANVDEDDDLLEIVLAGGSFTLGDATNHQGTLLVLEPNAPDLSILGLEILGNRIQGDSQTVRATVTNEGPRAATALFRLLVGGAPTGPDQTTGLDAGATTTLDFPWTPNAFGTQTVTIAADPVGAVRELDETDNEASLSIRILVPPVAAFSAAPPTPQETDTVQLTDESTDADGPIETREWSCSDGFASDQADPVHRFADGGSYTCELTVTDEDGLTDTAASTLAVAHVPPQAAFGFTPAGPKETDTVAFVDQSAHPNAPQDGVASYAWTCSDGFTSPQANPLHRFADGATYTCTLTVHDDDGQASSASSTIPVVHVAPVADFTFSPAAPNPGDPVSFASTSTHPNAPTDDLVSFAWDFGDGSPLAGGTNPAHAYAAEGTHTVTLSVEDDDGLLASRTRTLSVGNFPPVADFDFSPSDPTDLEPVQFTDLSSDADGVIASWAWDFGGDGASTDPNPSHTFSDDGTYLVTLTVTDERGGVGSITRPVAVANVPPTAGFDLAPFPAFDGEALEFRDLSVDPDGSPAAWLWDFGDGSASTVQHPAKAYAEPGPYTVRLTVTDDDGAASTASMPLEVCRLLVATPLGPVGVHASPGTTTHGSVCARLGT